MLSVIIPTFNEEKRITPTLRLLCNWLEKNSFSYEVIVSDDGSDNTAEIVREFSKKNPKVSLVKFEKRVGKGAALNRALRLVRGDALLYDADAAVHPRFIARALTFLNQNDVVIGSRNLPLSKRLGFFPFERRIATKLFLSVANLLFSLNVSDSQCGFKLLSKKSVENLLPLLKHSGYEWDVELLAKARMSKMLIAEIPVEWTAVRGSKMKKRSVLPMSLGILELKAELFLQDFLSAFENVVGVSSPADNDVGGVDAQGIQLQA
ncbi:MAG: glycosyltransferase [Candidatus Micrarchaeia archaeon]